jgi:hypothetical protein
MRRADCTPTPNHINNANTDNLPSAACSHFRHNQTSYAA